MNTSESSLRTALRVAGRHLKLSAVFLNVSWWLATCLGVWLVLFILDNLLKLPAGLRLPLAIGGVALVGLGFLRRIYATLRLRPRAERTAVLLEKRYGLADNVLINACQFEGRELRPEEQAFAQRTVGEGARQMSDIRLADLWDRRQLLSWGSAALFLSVVWAAYLLLFPRYVLNAGGRFLIPLADRPPAAAVRLTVKPTSDLALVEGENLEIIAEVDGPLRHPPVVVWKEGDAPVEPHPSAGENTLMAAAPDAPTRYHYLFSDVRRPLAFRVFADNAYSRNVQVGIKSLPRLKESLFRITPPAYTGLGALTNPGPPASVSCLSGSRVDVTVAIEPEVTSAAWKIGGQALPLSATGRRWQATALVTNAGEYEIEAADTGLRKNVSLARSAVRLEADNPPEIDFLTDDRNRLVGLGAVLKLEVQARDDYGVAAIEVTSRPAEQDVSAQAPTVHKRWSYLGPPGPKGPFKETCTLEINPRDFKSDGAYLVEAWARDFRPEGAPAKSRPIMVRVKSADSMNVASDDPLAPAFAALRQTVLKQEKANGLTTTLKTYLEEALQKKTVPERRDAMGKQQKDAQASGQQALTAFPKTGEGKLYATRLSPLVEGEMTWVLGDLPKLDPAKPKVLPDRLREIETRQNYILMELISLLGQIAERKQDLLKSNALAREQETPPLVAPEEVAKELHEDLKRFVANEEKILERTKSLLDKAPQDLTEKEEKILGDMAREEAKWAKFFEEKLTDFSKLPTQDFADGSLAKEANSVFQEIKLAAKELYEKKMELAVPHEQSGLENAKKLEQNLERWLPDTPDNLKWNMEEPLQQTDIALAELPKELEDIVGDLIDKEEEMSQDIEDVSSPWLDSIDKGAGWGAMDGPISSMSAKGVTGNLLPNQMEIGGRSGEGRTGRSSGQMVGDTAEGKGGRETPTRLSQTPFEQGSVKDSAKNSEGGATGGGKMSGYTGEGLRGPAAPQTAQKMPRIADKQAKIRQEAEALALKLRGYKLPSGDLEAAILSMKRVEDAARKVDGLSVRRSFSRVVDTLDEAKKTIRTETGLHREKSKLPAWMRDEIRTGLQDGVPRGYEEMASEYFKAMAEKK